MALTLPLRFPIYPHLRHSARRSGRQKAAFYDFIGVWCISVPDSCSMHRWSPVYLTVVLLDSLVKDVLVLRRFFSKKWMVQIQSE